MLPAGQRSAMQTIILGSGSPLPDPERAGPATLVRTEVGDLLFDCGRGVLMRAAAAASGAGALRGLFLTHLHSDHTTDLNDVITSRWVTSFQPHPLPVFGPPGTTGLLAGHRGHARARHRLPHGPPRRSAVATDGGGHRGRARCRARGGLGAGDGGPHRPCTCAPDRGLPDRRGRGLGRHRRRHRPVPRTRRAVRRAPTCSSTPSSVAT